MELIPGLQFLAWAESVGIVLDPRYRPPTCMVFMADFAESRWWNLPGSAQEMSHLFSHLLAGVGPGKSCYLWPRSGVWQDVDRPHNRLEEARKMISTGPAIPYGFRGAVKYPAEELGMMLDRVVTHLNTTSCDDMFFVPDDGRFIVQTDHHGVVHGRCRDAACMNGLIEHMARGSYSLPTEPLDWTFKWPSWMAK